VARLEIVEDPVDSGGGLAPLDVDRLGRYTGYVTIMRRPGLVVLVLVMLCAGCGLGNLLSTSPSSGTETDSFSSTLTVGGSSVSTFTVAQSGTVTVTLTALAAAGPVGLGIGTPNGTTCLMTSSTASVVPGASPQLTATENAGNYCVEIFDPGTLTALTTFSFTVVHP
jgi:hypothetical protein